MRAGDVASRLHLSSSRTRPTMGQRARHPRDPTPTGTSLPSVDETTVAPGRSALTTVVVSTILVCVFTMPMALFGVVIANDEDASAPNVLAVPRPEGWTRRELEAWGCSGSGGEFCIYVVVSPTPATSRAEAEADYSYFLRRIGWTPVAGVAGLSTFQWGNPGEEIVLGVGAEDPYRYSMSTYGEPPRDTDAIVEVSFADLGAASRRAVGVKLISTAAALTVAPTVIFAFRRTHARRRRTGAAIPGANSAK